MGTEGAQLSGVYKHILQCARVAPIFLHFSPSVKTSMLGEELLER